MVHAGPGGQLSARALAQSRDHANVRRAVWCRCWPRKLLRQLPCEWRTDVELRVAGAHFCLGWPLYMAEAKALLAVYARSYDMTFVRPGCARLLQPAASGCCLGSGCSLRRFSLPRRVLTLRCLAGAGRPHQVAGRWHHCNRGACLQADVQLMHCAVADECANQEPVIAQLAPLASH